MLVITVCVVDAAECGFSILVVVSTVATVTGDEAVVVIAAFGSVCTAIATPSLFFLRVTVPLRLRSGSSNTESSSSSLYKGCSERETTNFKVKLQILILHLILIVQNKFFSHDIRLKY